MNAEKQPQDFHHRKMRPAERWTIISSVSALLVVVISSLWHIAAADVNANQVPQLTQRVRAIEQYDKAISSDVVLIPPLVNRVSALEAKASALDNQKQNDQERFSTIQSELRDINAKLDRRLPPANPQARVRRPETPSIDRVNP